MVFYKEEFNYNTGIFFAHCGNKKKVDEISQGNEILSINEMESFSEKENFSSPLDIKDLKNRFNKMTTSGVLPASESKKY